MESVNSENAIVSPENVVELYDMSYVFLTLHDHESERLFDYSNGYFSPIIIAAYDLTTQQVPIT